MTKADEERAAKEAEDARVQQERAQRKMELAQLPVLSFEEYDAAMKKWLLIKDPGIIKLLPALYVANQLDRDPVWVMIIGASGGGKTELVGSLLDFDKIALVSALTPNTFLSGFPGAKDASLLPKVNGKIMVFKDWTGVLSINKDARADIMGQLREIYDGEFIKHFGNGNSRTWKGKVGMLACCTPAVDLSSQMYASLGERFIQYRIGMPDRKETARRVLKNGSMMRQMRTELRNAMFAFMKGIDLTVEVPQLADDILEEIVRVANFATMARSGVIRDFGMKKEVQFVPAPEMPTRIVNQLQTISIALTIVNKGVFDPMDMKIIYKIALDSVPQTNRMVMMEMAKRDQRETSDIAAALGYPTAPIHMYLENLAMLGVARRIRAADSEEGGTADRWSLNDDFADILRTYEGIEAEINTEAAFAPVDFGPVPEENLT